MQGKEPVPQVQEADPERILQGALATRDAIATANHAREWPLLSSGALASAEEKHAAERVVQVFRPSTLVAVLASAAYSILPAAPVATRHANLAHRAGYARVCQPWRRVSTPRRPRLGLPVARPQTPCAGRFGRIVE